MATVSTGGPIVRITLKIYVALVQWEVVRPGATRLNLSWFSSEAELELVLGQSWRLLPVYRFTLRPASGATTPTQSSGQIHHSSMLVL